MIEDLDEDQVCEAISEGVDRAIWRMITGVTDCPSMDFWDTMTGAIKLAFENVAEDNIDKISQGDKP